MIPLEWADNIRNLGDLNHLLSVIKDATEDGVAPNEERIEHLFVGQSFRGLMVPFKHVTDLAMLLGFVERISGKLALTSSGSGFLLRNPGNTYEITADQQEMLLLNLLFSRSELSKCYDSLVELFYFDKSASRYILGERHAAAGSAISAMRRLSFSAGFVDFDDNGKAAVHSRFNEFISRKLRFLRNPEWDIAEPSPTDIEASRHAERMIAASETARLAALGLRILADRVEIVSEYDATTGFDIMSFAGTVPNSSVYDRFIEVKSSKDTKTRFYLTQNELKAAREYGEKYSIVFVGNHAIDKSISECVIKEIRNPASSLFDTEKFKIDAKKLIVTEVEKPSSGRR